ncbi:hypothetical protein PRZ48_011756 [Zasmidium cellare]|uniref:Uncharacterized protein n=1 Tax=Zasmidium cellare TaxID=395010 RepID=A0ABR0E7W5_ZASCE|nr:hypothetical protein PRZ48_011756 [Zasmidium cellare]
MATTPESTKLDNTTTPTQEPTNTSSTTTTQPQPQQTTSILHDDSIPVATKFSRLSEQHKSTERSRSRSRGPDSLDGEVRRSSAADVRRSSVWNQDKEKKQRSKIAKLMDHHWVPDFLK